MTTMSLWNFVSGFSQGLGFVIGAVVAVAVCFALTKLWNAL